MPPLSDHSTIQLATNALACDFETDTGFLRRISHGDLEIIRAIYGAVRDENWNTIEPRLKIQELRRERNRFRLSFDAQCKASGIDFWWTGSIEAEGARLNFRFEGEARSAFRKNRIGLCILHPIRECAGLSCMIRDLQGNWAKSSFPDKISPHQPFKNLRGLRWSLNGEVEAELHFSGDVFETEDQRNWADASFKTYCTPLEHPFPVVIEAGTAVRQEVVLELRSQKLLFFTPDKGTEIDLESHFELPIPPLGLGVASHGAELSELELLSLRQLRLHHLRVDLYFTRSDWPAAYRTAEKQARAIGAGLEVALFLTDNAPQELMAFCELIDRKIVRWCLVFHQRESSTSERWLKLADQVLDGLAVVAGTNAYFAELNRTPPPKGYRAAYSINPQVHAFDDRTLMENLEAQTATIDSGLQLCPEGLFLSPITLRPRFNPNATVEVRHSAGELPSAVDRRQRTLVGACWTAGSLATLLRCHGVASLTYFETTGWRGVMETSRGSPLPEQFGSSPNELFPIYSVFEFLAGASSVLALSAAPEGLAILGLRDAKGTRRYLLANLEIAPRQVRCRFTGPSLEVGLLCDANIDSIRNGLPLRPQVYPVTGGNCDIDLPGMSIALIRTAS
jgi:D-apionolactonase